MTQPRIEPLARHRELLPLLQRWFESAWPSYYGPGGPGDARRDLLAFAGGDRLPVGVVAFVGDEPVGVAALKADSIASRAHLGPWLAAGLVSPSHRGRGIGAALVDAVEAVARELGHANVYCGTARAGRLLERRGWRLLERIEHDGERLGVYAKPVRPDAAGPPERADRAGAIAVEALPAARRP